jgi:hypothetical protein
MARVVPQIGAALLSPSPWPSPCARDRVAAARSCAPRLSVTRLPFVPQTCSTVQPACPVGLGHRSLDEARPASELRDRQEALFLRTGARLNRRAVAATGGAGSAAGRRQHCFRITVSTGGGAAEDVRALDPLDRAPPPGCHSSPSWSGAAAKPERKRADHGSDSQKV